MRRRSVIAGLWAGTLPLPARAQKAGKVYRLALLSGGTGTSRVALVAEFMAAMRNLGYVEGQNLVIESRSADDKFETLPTLAKELLAWNPDVLFVSTTPAAVAAKTATSTVPIVMVGVADPLAAGLVTSLSRPGHNVTGITNIGAELGGKRIEILKEIIPAASRFAVLINPDDPNAPLQTKYAELAADTLRVKLEPVLHVRQEADLKVAFEAATRAKSAAALRMIDPTVTSLREQTVSLAAQYRLPVIYPFREDVAAGGLISYGSSLPSQWRQAASFVHRIFGGAKPADLPVVQPTKFELVINMKTAKALGLNIPPSILARADEVIE